MLPEKQQEAYQAFSDAVRQNDILDAKTTRLVYLASAMAIGCYP
tara:strand:+ start:342 stop:473 length:132 start_codon:yes stop_codon:yes gene_type:complete